MAERSHRNMNGKDSINSSAKNQKKASSVQMAQKQLSNSSHNPSQDPSLKGYFNKQPPRKLVETKQSQKGSSGQFSQRRLSAGNRPESNEDSFYSLHNQSLQLLGKKNKKYTPNIYQSVQSLPTAVIDHNMSAPNLSKPVPQVAFASPSVNKA